MLRKKSEKEEKIIWVKEHGRGRSTSIYQKGGWKQCDSVTHCEKSKWFLYLLGRNPKLC